jgi:hypothetical protein
MARSIKSRCDDLGQRHPRLMFMVVLVAASATTLILLLFPQGQTVLYKVF